MSMKNSNDTTRNRTHDLPTCSTVPQQTAPPHAPHFDRENNTNLTFMGPCIMIYFYSKTNQMHNFWVYWISLCMFWMVFPSIIRSSRLYTQHQVYVIQVSWLLASGHGMELVCTVLNSWWWMERPSETCREIINKLENCASSWFYYRNNTNQCMNAYCTRQVW